MIGLLSFVVAWYQIDCSLCLSDLSPSGLPVMLEETDYNRIPFAWVVVARSLPHKTVRKLAGNGQCLPLCGALMASSVMALTWASAPVALEDADSQEAPSPKRPRIPNEVVEVCDSQLDTYD